MPWGQAEKENWFQKQKIQRSYQDEVVAKIEKLAEHFEIIKYGALSLDPKRYPLFLLKSKNFDDSKKTALITGGVHGYETSGVQGAIEFLKNHSEAYLDKFNIVCAPCISPWAYEVIHRWNPKAIDPNRSFYQDSPCEESKLFLEAIKKLNIKPVVHFDLHETTDTDNTVFRPALEARDGVPQDLWDIPDGFYLVGDTSNPRPDFQKAMIDSVRQVTHIAPADQNQKIIGVPIEQEGVINYDVKKLHLCAGFSEAEYVTTTEVYPDSPKANDQICKDAQVEAVKGGLDYILNI